MATGRVRHSWIARNPQYGPRNQPIWPTNAGRYESGTSSPVRDPNRVLERDPEAERCAVEDERRGHDQPEHPDREHAGRHRDSEGKRMVDHEWYVEEQRPPGERRDDRVATDEAARDA